MRDIAFFNQEINRLSADSSTSSVELLQFFDSLLIDFTLGESQSFPHNRARLIFLAKRENLSVRQRSLLHTVYQQIAGFAFRNQEIPISRKHLLIEGIRKGINWLSGLEDQSELPDLKIEEEKHHQIRFVIDSIHPTSDGTMLLGLADTFSEPVEVLLRKDPYNDLNRHARFFKPLDPLILHDFTQEGNQLISGLKSRIIYQPDFLVQVTDLSESFGTGDCNPLNWVIELLTPLRYNSALLVGKLVNDLLDISILHPDAVEEFGHGNLQKDVKLQAATLTDAEVESAANLVRTIHAPKIAELTKSLDGYREYIRVEPVFMSSADGIQGRLDLLIPRSKGFWEILELKTSTPPPYGVIRKNEIQVVLYNRLLSEATNHEIRIDGSIFYSKASANNRRNVPVGDHLGQIQSLDYYRNALVNLVFRMADPTDIPNILNYLNPSSKALEKGVDRRFGIEKFNAFFNLYSQASPLAKRFYLQCLSFLIREWIAEKTGQFMDPVRASESTSTGFASLWLDSIPRKKAWFSILPDLEATEFNDGAIRFILPAIPHQFRVGDRLILYPKPNPGESPLHAQLNKGVLTSVDEGSVVISMMNREAATPEKWFGLWCAEQDIFERNTFSQIQALNFLLKPNSSKLNKLLGTEEPEFDQHTFEISLSGRQAEVVNNALNAKDYFLIQGPPGTGKTSAVLTEIVRQSLVAGKRIVILAYTNRAIEEISNRLAQNEISFFSFQSGKSPENESYRGYASRLKSSTVWVSTLAGFSNRIFDFLRIARTPDMVIVDEASQVSEPQLSGVLAAFPKFVLIGDHHQLPPVVLQDTVFRQFAADETLPIDYGASVFERLWRINRNNRWKATGTLNLHFRMHKEVANLIREVYLPESLEEGRTLQQEPLMPSVSAITQGNRVAFVPTLEVGIGKLNEEEARKVVDFAKQFLEAGILADDIGIIAPWRLQLEAIRKHLRTELPGVEITVDTVERFQGSERKVILFSTSINNSKYAQILSSKGEVIESGMQFDRKLLVAISRASEAILIFGNQVFLNENPFYKSLIDQIPRLEE